MEKIHIVDIYASYCYYSCIEYTQAPIHKYRILKKSEGALREDTLTDGLTERGTDNTHAMIAERTRQKGSERTSCRGRRSRRRSTRNRLPSADIVINIIILLYGFVAAIRWTRVACVRASPRYRKVECSRRNGRNVHAAERERQRPQTNAASCALRFTQKNRFVDSGTVALECMEKEV